MKVTHKGILDWLFDCPKPGDIRYRTWWAWFPTWCYIRGTKSKLGRYEMVWLERVYARQKACLHFCSTGNPHATGSSHCVSWDNDAFLTKEEYEAAT